MRGVEGDLDRTTLLQNDCQCALSTVYLLHLAEKTWSPGTGSPQRISSLGPANFLSNSLSGEATRTPLALARHSSVG